MTWSQRLVRFVICYLILAAVILIASKGMDAMQSRHLFGALAGFTVDEIRGLQREPPSDRLQTEVNAMNIQELRRRVDSIESQRSEVRMAVIEAKLDTLFELTRVLIGAAIVYCVQVIGSLVSYFSSRNKRSAAAMD